jgi:hypothetical protein
MQLMPNRPFTVFVELWMGPEMFFCDYKLSTIGLLDHQLDVIGTSIIRPANEENRRTIRSWIKNTK